MKTIQDIIHDLDSSEWLVSAARSALRLDPVEAAIDAKLLAVALHDRAEKACAFPAFL